MRNQKAQGGGGAATTTQLDSMVTGQHRFKYFKRPVMPRVNAYPPHFMLAPTGGTGGENNVNNNLDFTDGPTESSTKDIAIQTQYRESEAQTIPYTPAYVIPPGQDPEVLLLKNLTYDEGLPMGEKEMAMIGYARAKRDLEVNLPPFTDEASLHLRKRLMEAQEMREFRMREAEIDRKRNEKLEKLTEALNDREQSNEFMSSQRLESIRLLRMEEREKVLLKIRNKRIKALRRLALERNGCDPALACDNTSTSHHVSKKGGDIIDAFFDRGSELYAPVRRQGELGPPPANRYDIGSRTQPLDNLGNILALEYTIPRRLMGASPTEHVAPPLLGATLPVGAMRAPRAEGRIRAAEPRLTSAAARALRQTKRDVEEMHMILTHKKSGAPYTKTNVPFTSKQQSGQQQMDSPNGPATLPASRGNDEGELRPFSAENPSSQQASPTRSTGPAVSSLLSKKPKARPPTPDITSQRENAFTAAAHDDHKPATSPGTHRHRHRHAQYNPAAHHNVSQEDYLMAVTLLQRLIRGRAVQNIMFEGKYRRRELIQELKAADEADLAVKQEAIDEGVEETERRVFREQTTRDSTVEAVAGGGATQLLVTLSQEKNRLEMMAFLQAQALQAMEDRRYLEAAEAGRRQMEGLEYPNENRQIV
jgi:hypothetical protein